jgi:hypothetical protein
MRPWLFKQSPRRRKPQRELICGVGTAQDESASPLGTVHRVRSRISLLLLTWRTRLKKSLSHLYRRTPVT